MPPRYAVIPAAGEGKRIKPYSEKVPKPMIQVLGPKRYSWLLTWREYLFLTFYALAVSGFLTGRTFFCSFLAFKSASFLVEAGF